MPHTAAELGVSFRNALKAAPGPAGRQQVCELLKQALADREYIAATL